MTEVRPAKPTRAAPPHSNGVATTSGSPFCECSLFKHPSSGGDVLLQVPYDPQSSGREGGHSGRWIQRENSRNVVCVECATLPAAR